MNFVQKVIAGDASVNEIDDYIDAWHMGDSGMPISEFLGMTREEYYEWIYDPRVIKHIIETHRGLV